MVKSLTDRLSTLKQQLSLADSASGTDSALNQASDQPSSNQLNQSSLSAKPASHQSTTLVAKKNPTNLPDNPVDPSVDQKFNLVIYGVKENSKRTQRRARTKLDIKACVQVMEEAFNDEKVKRSYSLGMKWEVWVLKGGRCDISHLIECHYETELKHS